MAFKIMKIWASVIQISWLKVLDKMCVWVGVCVGVCVCACMHACMYIYPFDSGMYELV